MFDIISNIVRVVCDLAIVVLLVQLLKEVKKK